MKKRLLLIFLVLTLLFSSIPVSAKVRFHIPKKNKTETQKMVNTEITRVIKKDLKITKGMDEKKAYKKMARWVVKNYSYLSMQSNIYKGWEIRQLNCKGYAYMMLKMCEITGIKCRYIKGYVWKDGRFQCHGWNKVRVNGKWYYSDICWYDSPWYPNYLLSRKLWQRPRHKIKKIYDRIA